MQTQQLILVMIELINIYNDCISFGKFVYYANRFQPATDFGDGGNAAAYCRRLYWKINLAEPLLRKDNELHLGNENWDDASLLSALEKNRHWEQARNWAKQLEASGSPWKSALHHVTESQVVLKFVNLFVKWSLCYRLNLCLNLNQLSDLY